MDFDLACFLNDLKNAEEPGDKWYEYEEYPDGDESYARQPITIPLPEGGNTTQYFITGWW